MSTIFAETIARAISEYRQMLRKYLPQAERVIRLNKLNLKDPSIYENDIALYRAAQSIIEDIENHVDIPEQGYYSYSGIAKFCEYLKEYLAHYEVEENQVIHRAQKASRALIQAIQLVTLPKSRLNEKTAQKLEKCNEIIANFGTEEQHEIHLNNLEKYKVVNEGFYIVIIENFKRRIREKNTEELLSQ